MITATSSPQSNTAMQASELYIAAATTNADQSVQSANVDVLTSAYQPAQTEAIVAPTLVTQLVVEAEVLPHTASIASAVVTESFYRACQRILMHCLLNC